MSTTGLEPAIPARERPLSHALHGLVNYTKGCRLISATILETASVWFSAGFRIFGTASTQDIKVILLSPYWNDANDYTSTGVADFNLLVSSEWLNGLSTFCASRQVDTTMSRSFK